MEKKNLKKLNLSKFKSSVMNLKEQDSIKGGANTTSTGSSVTAAAYNVTVEKETIPEYDF